MGIQETAQDVKHLVQALAEGKELEVRYRHSSEAKWQPYEVADGQLGFDLMRYEHRIKRDLRAELFSLIQQYGAARYEEAVADAYNRPAIVDRHQKKGHELRVQIEEIVNGLFGVTK